MIEFEPFVAWLASLWSGGECAICNALRNDFDGLVNLGIGAASAAAAAAGTAAGSANRAGRETRDAFNNAYDQASGEGGAAPPPRDSNWFSDTLRRRSEEVGGGSAPTGAPTSFNDAMQQLGNSDAARAATARMASSQSPPMSPGSLHYFSGFPRDDAR